MSGCVLFIGGWVIPAVVGAAGYTVWIVPFYAAAFHLVVRSPAFRTLARLPLAPDTSNVPIGAFVGGWIITLMPMLAAYGVGWLFALLL
jgi:hypothetical protein